MYVFLFLLMRPYIVIKIYSLVYIYFSVINFFQKVKRESKIGHFWIYKNVQF